MSELNENRCAVMLPSGPLFDGLYDEILEFAIIETGLIPFRLPLSSQSPTPINVFVDEIEQAGALFADVSDNTSEIWFAVGCAVALGKLLCLISSRPETNAPPGIQHLPLIRYPAYAFPSDYTQLRQNITAQLSAIMPQAGITLPQTNAAKPELYVPLLPLTSASKSSDELASYEILALTIIDLKATDTGLSPRALGLEMQASESGHLTSHAMNALKLRKFIQRKPVQISEGNELHISENLFITRTGEDWLIRHGKRATSPRSGAQSREQFLNSR